METSIQRAERLAAACPVKTGDQVLIGKTVHIVQRPSAVLAGVVVLWCRDGDRLRASHFDVLDDEPHDQCAECRKTWKVQSQLQQLRSDH